MTLAPANNHLLLHHLRFLASLLDPSPFIGTGTA